MDDEIARPCVSAVTWEVLHRKAGQDAPCQGKAYGGTLQTQAWRQ